MQGVCSPFWVIPKGPVMWTGGCVPPPGVSEPQQRWLWRPFSPPTKIETSSRISGPESPRGLSASREPPASLGGRVVPQPRLHPHAAPAGAPLTGSGLFQCVPSAIVSFAVSRRNVNAVSPASGPVRSWGAAGQLPGPGEARAGRGADGRVHGCVCVWERVHAPARGARRLGPTAGCASPPTLWSAQGPGPG